MAPGNLPALVDSAWGLIKLSRYSAAETAAREVIKAAPERFHGYWLQAYARAGMSDLSGTRVSLKHAARINPAFRDLYERSLNLPDQDDPLSLFNGPLPFEPGGIPAPAPTRFPWGWLVLAGLGGAALAELRILIRSSSGKGFSSRYRLARGA